MQYYRIVLCLVFCLCLFKGYSQSSSIQDSIDLYSLNEPKKAIPFLKDLVEIQKNEKKWDKYVLNLYNIGHNYYEAYDNESSYKYNQEAEKVAKKYLNESDNILSFIYHLYGDLAYERRNWESASSQYLASLNVDLKQKEPSQELIAIKYFKIAKVFNEAGDYEQAVYYARRSLEKVNSIGELDYKDLPLILYNELGYYSYNLKDYKSAKKYLNKANDLLKKIDKNLLMYAPTFKMVYNNIALNAQATENYAETYDFLNKKMNLPHLTDKDIATIYKHRGTTLIKEKKYDEALEQLNLSLAIRKKYYKKHDYLSLVYQTIGEVYQSQKNYSKALENYQAAIIAVVYDFDDKNINKNPSLENIVHQVELLKSLSAKAKTLQLMKKYKASLEVYQICSQLIDKMRISFQHKGSKLFFMEEGNAIFEEAIATALMVGDKNMAFELAEKSKGMLLLEAMRGIEARLGLPADLVEKENGLKIDIAYYERKIWDERQKEEHNKEDIKKWENFVFNLKEEHTNLKNKYNKDYPEYYKLKYNSEVTSVRDIQRKLLSNKTAMISYFIGKEQFFVFTITKKGVEVTTLEKTDNLTDWVENMRLSLQRDNRITNLHQTYYQTGFQLYQLFLAPALKNISQDINSLIIIPDDQLNFIPFETLLTSDPNLTSPRYELKKLPYLIRDYQITYGYSATLLLEGLKNREKKNLKPFGGFVPSFQEGNSIQRGCDGDLLGNLPFGRENIVTINDIMDGQLYFDDKATIDDFKTLAEEYKILHLCTHACAEMDFKDTRIYFSDKELLAFELYNMPLNAELAVLSACETGIGELKRGEGVMSLARAFMYSGCPSVVTSLWSVDDKSTSEVMRYFYQHIKDGKTKDKALHQAKLDYLEGKGIEGSHPFYWSGFVHIGNTEPLFGDDNNGTNHRYWWLAGSLVLLLLGFLLY